MRGTLARGHRDSPPPRLDAESTNSAVDSICLGFLGRLIAFPVRFRADFRPARGCRVRALLSGQHRHRHGSSLQGAAVCQQRPGTSRKRTPPWAFRLRTSSPRWSGLQANPARFSLGNRFGKAEAASSTLPRLCQSGWPTPPVCRGIHRLLLDPARHGQLPASPARSLPNHLWEQDTHSSRHWFCQRRRRCGCKDDVLWSFVRVNGPYEWLKDFDLVLHLEKKGDCSE